MERAYRRILSELLDDIVTGRIAAGDRLPTVDDIAARHACSPSVAREAIRALEERRVVEVQAGQGQEVLDSDRWVAPAAAAPAAALLRHPGARLLREGVDFLQLVETQAASLAAAKVRDGDL